jgi:hypothetical protein
MIHSRALLCCAFLASFLPSPCFADVFLGVQWVEKRAGFRVHPNFPPEDAGDRIRQLQVFDCAARAWTDQTRAEFRFVLEGEAESAGFMRDGVNTISWADADGEAALAVTCYFGRQGAMSDFDTIFFRSTSGFENRWSGAQEAPPKAWDIQAIAAHELGHALGLGHLPDPDSTMYFKVSQPGVGLRTLNDSDRECVETLYGRRSEAAPALAITGLVPERGPTDGGHEVLIAGVNFTYASESELLLDGASLSHERWEVSDCGAVRILRMPSRDPGEVTLELRNSFGAAAAAYTYEGEPLVLSRGDANADGRRDISDAQSVLGVLFLGLPPALACDKAGDVNDDGRVEIADASYLLNFLFLGGADPRSPFPLCGSDPTRDGLSCDRFPPCE